MKQLRLFASVALVLSVSTSAMALRPPQTSARPSPAGSVIDVILNRDRSKQETKRDRERAKELRKQDKERMKAIREDNREREKDLREDAREREKDARERDRDQAS